MLKKEIKLAYIDNENCPLSGALPFRCLVSEGVSLPFRAEVTVFSGTPLDPEKLDACLLTKTEITLMQYDTTGNLSRGRKFQGVITSYNDLGLISDLEGFEPQSDCYGYEITIEPEMVLMGITPRTRRFDSGKTPTDIITGIFEEYHLQCRIDQDLFDRMPGSGQIAQQNNETDLNFINRVCFNYGFNYVFELESPYSDFSAASVIFSRGYVTGNSHAITGNTLADLSRIPCVTGKSGTRSFGDGTITLDRLVRTGIAGSRSIHDKSRSHLSEAPILSNSFEPVRGEGSNPGESIQSFWKETSASVDRVFRNRTLISARDFAVAPGIVLDTGTARYLTVRTRFSFNLNCPEGFRSVRDNPEREDELSLTAVAVPVPEKTDHTLGPLCCFGPIPENPTAATAFSLTEIPRPGRSSRTTAVSNLRSNAVLKEESAGNAMIVRATVCNKDGKTSVTNSLEPGMIVTSENDNTAFPAMFYALPENGGSTSAIEVNYVSMSGGSAPLGNFPKVGQKVLLLYTGSSYYFMGYLPDRNALSTYSTELRNDLLHSSFLNSGYDPDNTAASNTDKVPDNENRDIRNQYFSFSRFKSAQVLVEYIIMQERLEPFMRCLALKFNTNKIIEVYDKHKADANTYFEAVKTKRQALDTATGTSVSTAQSELATAYTDLSDIAGTIVTGIQDVADVSDRISSILASEKDKKNSRYSGSDDEKKSQILGDLLGVVCCDLFHDGTHRIFGSNLESMATDDITSIAGGSINLHADKNVYITADTAINLQVGNNSISINGNTIAMAVAYFNALVSPWDGKITMSPITGVSISGYQFSASGLTSANVGDSFGGSLGTRGGIMTMTAPKIKLTNMGGPAYLKTIGKLANKAVIGTADAISVLANTDNSELASKIINDVSGYVNTLITAAGDIWSTVKTVQNNLKAETSNLKTWGTMAVSAIMVAMDLIDGLQSIIANSMLESKEKDNVFVKRTKENNYISGRDIYLMVTSSIRIATLIANGIALMIGNLKSEKVSAAELTSDGITLSGNEVTQIAMENKVKASGLAAIDTQRGNNNQI